MKTLTLSLALVLACCALSAGAATPEEIVAQKRQVASAANPQADALKAKLAVEVTKIVKAGRLAPFRTLYGEGGLRYHWREPWQMVYTLSLALPYLDADLQTKVKAYLKDEMTTRPPWDVKLLGPEGTLRQADDLPKAVFQADCKGGEVRNAFFAYALWVYADRTGDVQTIKNNWKAIQTSYAAKIGSKPNLETVSSAVGLARLAKLVGDDAAAQSATRQATDAIAACQNFSAVQASATKLYTGKEKWIRETQSVLYAFFDLTPEAARVLTATPELKAEAAKYAAIGWRDWPFWWMAQAPVGDSGYYGEGCCAGPEQQTMLFGYEAWVANTPADKLAYYSDVPDALVGDCGWIQNTVTALDAFGQTTWVPATK